MVVEAFHPAVVVGDLAAEGVCEVEKVKRSSRGRRPPPRLVNCLLLHHRGSPGHVGCFRGGVAAFGEVIEGSEVGVDNARTYAY